MADIIIPQKPCKKCGQLMRLAPNKLRYACRECGHRRERTYRERVRQTKATRVLPILNPHFIPASRRCSGCFITKPIDMFHQRKVRVRGLTSGLTKCDKCRSRQDPKICKKCFILKPITEYRRRPSNPDGLNSVCQQCEQSYTRKYKSNPEYKARARQNAATPEARLATRKARIKLKYKLPYGDYLALVKAQNGLCVICQKPPTKQNRPLAIDHDHQTGQVRGLLCSACNAILGRWDDSPDTAERARQYLIKFRQLKLVV